MRIPRVLIDWVLIALASMALVLALSFTSFGHALDNILYDRILPLRASPPDDRIIIVAIDNASLQAIGKWPWPRHDHAQLLDQLGAAHPSAIAYDVLFTEASPDDAMLASALRRANPAYLPLLLDQAGSNAVPVLPVPSLRSAAAGVGHVNVHFDGDGLVRRADPVFVAGGRAWPHLITRMTGGPPANTPTPIAFQSTPGTFRSISFADAMAGRVPPTFFKDKYVLVGATADGMGDDFSVPLRGGGKMAGIELLANLLNTILAGEPIHMAPPWLAALVNILPLGLSLYGFWFWRPRAMLLIGSSFGLLLIGGSIALFALSGWWIGPLAGVAGLLVAYPAWGWRRLASLSASVERDLAAMGQRSGGFASTDRIGAQQRQIAAVAEANAALRSSAEAREQALQALSHDMRAPQAGIIMLVEREGKAMGPSIAARLTGLARRTMALADNFVQLARINETPFAPEDTNLGDLLNEAIDEMYPITSAKHISMIANEPEQPCYIMAEPGLLLRALLNLLDNAIKYSRDGEAVHGSVFADGAFICCVIRDEGAGMTGEQVAGLFARFGSVGSARHQGASGSGLGLALVKSVMDRHGGTITCESAIGKGTSFTLRFPASLAEEAG